MSKVTWHADHFPRLVRSKKGRYYLCYEDASGKKHRRGPFRSKRDAELAGVELQYPLGAPQNKNVWNPHPCRERR